MTSIAPTGSNDALPDADHLARAVLDSLGQRIGQKYAWGIFRTLFWGLVSFGVWPILVWLRHFGELVQTEQVQLEHLAQWTQSQRAGPLSDDLARCAKRLKRYGWMESGAIACMVFLVIFGSWFLFSQGQSPWDLLWGGTYGFTTNSTRRLHDVHLYWSSLLSAAYLFHAAQIVLHGLDMRRFARAMNRWAQREGVGPASIIKGRVGPGVPWLIAGLILIAMGVIWALPMTIAGWQRRHYILSAGPAIRRAIARQFAQIVHVHRPQLVLAPPASLRRWCERNLCGRQIPPHARFCPRCGAPAPVVGGMDRA